MSPQLIQIMLADDDTDDCLFFSDVLKKIPLTTNLTTVRNGAQLMVELAKTSKIPTVLFLDLNMPVKDGFECVLEIKQNKKLKAMPIIVFSTSFDKLIVDKLHENGVTNFFKKPNDFEKLTHLIHTALLAVIDNKEIKPGAKTFVLNY